VAVDEPLDWLHDGRLIAVEVAWASATARVLIEVDTAAARVGSLPLADMLPLAGERPSDQAGTLVIECDGVERVVIPHKQPWGPSEYVNAARIVSEPSGLLIEMSSGLTGASP
jgi:hypothetical protein